MRYLQAHAAKSGSVPFALRGPKSLRTVVAVVVAGAIGFVPAVAVSTPAFAAATGDTGDITIQNAPTATEGNDLSFTVKYTGSGAASYTVGVYADGASGHASSADYVAPATTLNFTGPATKQVVVKTVDDALYETNETLTLDITGATGDPVDQDSTIYDNDSKPSFSLTASPATVTESSTAKSTISASLSTKSGVDTVITLATSDGTATAGADYTALDTVHPPTITIPKGSLVGSTTVPVFVVNDLTKDKLNTESFTVTGTSDNASPHQATATVGIVDAQSTPVLALTDDGSNITEGAVDGHGDPVGITYTVTASSMSELPITVKWDAVTVTPQPNHDLATAGTDFDYPSSRTLTIQPGATTATFTIISPNDSLSENPEDYGIQISSPTNATVDPQASTVTTTINDYAHSPIPDVTISPVAVAEGNSGKQTRTFTATLSLKAGRAVTVNWATENDGTAHAVQATAGTDYVKKSGTLVFPPGVLTQTFTVDVIGDTVTEGDETFAINLASPDSTATIAHPDVPVTITDDDALPTVTFDGPTMKEGDSASAILLPIKLSNPSSNAIAFDIADSTNSNGGSATAAFDPTIPGSGDYTLLATSVVIYPGQTTGYVPVLVNGDKIFEGDEDAFFTATPHDVNDAGRISSQSQTVTARLLLQNDDAAPVLAIDNVTGNEGDTVAVTGTVKGQADQDVSVNVSFAGGSVKGSMPASANDFVNPGLTPVTIPVGTADGGTVSIGNVALTDDAEKEPDETILVTGTPTASVIPGVITIAASDGGTNKPPVTPTFNVPKSIDGAAAVPITGKAAAGATVDLWGAPMGETKAPLTKLSSTTADKNGAYGFSRSISQGYRFQIAVGDWTSAEKTVTVTQVPVFVANSPSKGLIMLAVQGNPRGSGQMVGVQRLVKGAWVTLWSGTTASSTNQWKVTSKVSSGISLTLRAYVSGSSANGIATGYSATKKFTVK